MLKVVESQLPTDRCMDVQNPKDNVGSTPLHCAASKGQLSVCKLFLNIIDKEDCNKNTRNKFEVTPLHFAEQNGHLPILEIFGNNLEDLKVKNKNKFTPLHFAAYNGYLVVAKILLKKMKIKNPKEVQGVCPK